MWANSVGSERRNFFRAGTLKNKSRTEIVVPTAGKFVAAQQLASGDFDGGTGLFVNGVCFEQQPADRCDGWQSLAAKAEGRDGEQVFDIDELAGGVALKRQERIVAQHAAAVVGDADQAAARVLDIDAYFGGTGVERVFEEFLDDGGRPLDYFAGSDFVGDVIGENPDAAHIYSVSRTEKIRRVPGLETGRPTDLCSYLSWRRLAAHGGQKFRVAAGSGEFVDQ